jgi:hypothetical protein
MAGDAMSEAADLSAEHAKEIVTNFLPGVSPSLLSFIVFGTTKPFRHYMYKKFVPRRFQPHLPLTARPSSSPVSTRESKTSGDRYASVRMSRNNEHGIGLQTMKPAKVPHSNYTDSEDERPILIQQLRFSSKVNRI